VVVGKDDRVLREIASLTKIMTCYMVCSLIEEMGVDPKTSFVSVSRRAATQVGTTACLKEGWTLSVYDLLHGLMLPSGNDAAIALAENFGAYLNILKERRKLKPGIIETGDPVSEFVSEMNALAKRMHLKASRFSNPHGLADRSNKSTATDMA